MSLRKTGRAILLEGTSQTINGSLGLGTYAIGGYSRIVGQFSGVGSATFQWNSQQVSGTTLVASSIPVNAGLTVFDQVNYGGRFMNFAFSAANSANFTYFIVGEPAR